MRPWPELRMAIAESPYGILDLEPDESTALLYATLLLGAHTPMVPRSWSRLRVNPAGALVAAAARGAGPWTGRLLAAPFELPASTDVFGEIIRAAFADSLLRPADASAWSARASQTRNEAIVQAGPRLLASVGEERERWTQAW